MVVWLCGLVLVARQDDEGQRLGRTCSSEQMRRVWTKLERPFLADICRRQDVEGHEMGLGGTKCPSFCSIACCLPMERHVMVKERGDIPTLEIRRDSLTAAKWVNGTSRRSGFEALLQNRESPEVVAVV